MVWLAVDEDGSEWIYSNKPLRNTDLITGGIWLVNKYLPSGVAIILPKGTINKLIGYSLTWKDKPVWYNGKDNKTPLEIYL